MNINSIALEKKNIKDFVYDLIAVSIIMFVPTLSHMTFLPIYYLEPMRILLLASLIFTSKKNVYVMTFLLPIFSFIVSSHPSFYKVWLISTELSINVFLFIYLTKFFRNYFSPMLISVITSKLFYYSAKYFLIQLGLISGELITTPLIFQLIVTAFVTIVIGIFYKKRI